MANTNSAEAWRARWHCLECGAEFPEKAIIDTDNGDGCPKCECTDITEVVGGDGCTLRFSGGSK